MDLYKLFIRLLKELGCYNAFLNNFKKLPTFIVGNAYSNSADLKKFVLNFEVLHERTSSIELLINDAFSWDKSKEGNQYWFDIYNIFIELRRSTSIYDTELVDAVVLKKVIEFIKTRN